MVKCTLTKFISPHKVVQIDVQVREPALLEAHKPRLIAQCAAIVPLAKVSCLVTSISHNVGRSALSTVDVVITCSTQSV